MYVLRNIAAELIFFYMWLSVWSITSSHNKFIFSLVYILSTHEDTPTK